MLNVRLELTTMIESHAPLTEPAGCPSVNLDLHVFMHFLTGLHVPKKKKKAGKK